MPVFEYECRNCGHVFEVFRQRRDSATDPKCPACGTPNVERILSAFSGKMSGGGGCASAPLGFG